MSKVFDEKDMEYRPYDNGEVPYTQRIEREDFFSKREVRGCTKEEFIALIKKVQPGSDFDEKDFRQVFLDWFKGGSEDPKEQSKITKGGVKIGGIK